MPIDRVSVLFLSCLVSFSAAGVVDEGALRAAAEAPDGQAKLAAGELRRVAGPALDAMAADAAGKKFATAFTSSPVMLGDLMFSGSLPDDPAKALRILKSIWADNPADFASPEERGTAVAVALTYGAASWPEDKAKATYAYYRDSRKAGKLHPVFNTLEPWEKRYVVSVGGNGSYSAWSDPASLAWARDNVKLPAKAYIDACWQAPYLSDNVFGDSINGERYYAPFAGMPLAQTVRDVGGVCGSLSHYGANAARANGIPAITMGEPGHCAYAVRLGRGEWTPAYSLSWQRGLHTSLWAGRTWTQLVLQDKVLSDRESYRRSTAHLFQARAMRDADPALAESAYRLALEAQPTNQPAWLEAAAFLKEKRKLDASGWKAVQSGAIKALAAYPEALSEVLDAINTPALASLPEDQRLDWLLEFHRAIAGQEGPVMWNLGQALGKQADALGGCTDQQLRFFEQALAIQTRSKSWLAPMVAWGQERFGKDAASSGQYFAVLAKAFSGSVADADPKALRAAIRSAVVAAESAKNVEAFQALGKAAAPLRKSPPLKPEPFDGDLLSSGGLLMPTSTCGWDWPEEHQGALEASGGRFHTNQQVRPGAVVRLGKLGDLSGIVIHDTSGSNMRREIPLKVSVSEDGERWTQVFRATEPQPVFRIPLAGKAPRVQFVKVERDDDRNEFFSLAGIQVYGRRLQ